MLGRVMQDAVFTRFSTLGIPLADCTIVNCYIDSILLEQLTHLEKLHNDMLTKVLLPLLPSKYQIYESCYAIPQLQMTKCVLDQS